MERNIVHIDISSFAVSIERLKNSHLRQRPVVVAYPDMIRSVVFATSPEAKENGIHRGMPLQLAHNLCKKIIVVPPNYELYHRAMNAMMKTLANFSPIIEPAGYGHAYLDMTGTTRLFGKTKDAAVKVQREVQTQLRLNSALGVAQNKLVSRIAATVVEPVGVQDVGFGTEKNFIAPLSVNTLPQIDYKIKQQLLELNLQTIGQVSEVSLYQLTQVFGAIGRKMYRISHGIDNTPERPPKSEPNVSEEETLTDDSNDIRQLRLILFKMVEKAAFRLRQDSRMTNKFFMEIDYSDHKKEFGQQKLSTPSYLESELFDAADSLLNKILTRRTRVRKMAVRFVQLVPAVKQMSLFETPVDSKDYHLSKALDDIRKRFGVGIIQVAT